MASVADFVSGSATCRISLGKHAGTGEEGFVEVKYRPNKMSPATDRKLRQMLEDGDPLAAAKVLVGVITSWDAEGPVIGERAVQRESTVAGETKTVTVWEDVELVKAGETVPLDAEVIAYVNWKFLLSVWQGIYADAMPDPQKGNG